MTQAPDAPQYVAERIRTALAADPRVAELGVTVKIVGSRVQVAGVVATQDRRILVEEIVRELMPEHEVQNEIQVLQVDVHPRPERLR